jgi:hypothetical protein
VAATYCSYFGKPQKYDVAELRPGEALLEQHHLRATAAVLREKAECAQMLVTHAGVAMAQSSSSVNRSTPRIFLIDILIPAIGCPCCSRQGQSIC